MSIGRIAILVAHGLVGWGLCAAIIAVGSRITTMENTLIIHAIAVPVIFFLVSLSYFRFFRYTAPIQTAASFTAFAIILDVFVVALLVQKSFAMFASVIGTWIPFALIFLATFATGTLMRKP
jgi:hypothetical protein